MHYNMCIILFQVGYRKNKHNEGDNPDFTQPFMYQQIRKQIPVTKKYADKLIAEGVVTQEEYEVCLILKFY